MSGNAFNAGIFHVSFNPSLLGVKALGTKISLKTNTFIVSVASPATIV